MGLFDSMKEKADELLGGAGKTDEMLTEHADKVEEYSDMGIDKAGDALDQATGGQYVDKIDQGQAALDEKIGE